MPKFAPGDNNGRFHGSYSRHLEMEKFPAKVPAIPALSEDPKTAGGDDPEIVGDSVAKKLPFFRNCPSKELQDGSSELAEARVVPVVGHVAVHHAPASFNGIEVRTVGRDEVQDALASWPFQPVPHN